MIFYRILFLYKNFLCLLFYLKYIFFQKTEFYTELTFF